MALAEKATEVAKNPWGQWVAVLLALAGLGTQYFTLEQTKTDLLTEQKVTSERRLEAGKVGGDADEKLAESLADTQDKLAAVWKHCEAMTSRNRKRTLQQDDAIDRQKQLIRRVAYGVDDVRFTVQMLHPNRRNAAFDREKSFVESVEDDEEILSDSTEEPEPMPPPALKKGGLKLKKIAVKELRARREQLQKIEAPVMATPEDE